MKEFDLLPLLEYIPASSLEYQDWVNVGMALHKEGYRMEIWDEWSRKDVARYHEGECAKKWATFDTSNNHLITGATITQMAKDNGWVPKGGNTVINWDSPIMAGEYQIIDPSWVEDEPIEIPKTKDWHPVQDIKTYLKTLFKGNEHVGYVVKTYEHVDKDTGEITYSPTKGFSSRTCDQLLAEIEKYERSGLPEETVIENVFGTVNEKAGAWIRFNPLDGKGVKNENVTDYRYTLVESDHMDIGKQRALLTELNLPIAALVYSGGKSVHAIVKVNAQSYEIYRERVDFIYSVMERNGFRIDKQNRNPSRLSRMPGIIRNGQKQFLISTDVGARGYDEWVEWLQDKDDNLPEIKTLDDIWGNLPPLANPLINGILREGHKMLVAGPSKAGKSFALIQLCVAFAEGAKWFGWQCEQGKVLYINLELDSASCYHRFYDVYSAWGLEPKNINNIAVWNLRGKTVPMDKLAPRIIRRAKEEGFAAVILDPIYKVITGDENSADQMAHFCNQFDKICTELGCAMIYCHHHSKGSQLGKRSMDRASGSGVFARDPDALIDLLEVNVSDAEMVFEEGVERPSPNATAWCIECTLREFATPPKKYVWFNYPLHTPDDDEVIKKCASVDIATIARKRGSINGNNVKQAVRKSKAQQVEEIYRLAVGFDPKTVVTVEHVANELQVSARTARRYIEESKKFKIYNAKLIPLELWELESKS